MSNTRIEDMDREVIVVKYKELAARVHEMSRYVSSAKRQVELAKSVKAKSMQDYRARITAFLELKVEDMHLADIPITDPMFRMMMLHIEATDPGSSPAHRLKCIEKAEIMQNKREGKTQAQERYKKKKIPEMKEEPKLKEFESEFFDDKTVIEASSEAPSEASDYTAPDIDMEEPEVVPEHIPEPATEVKEGSAPGPSLDEVDSFFSN